MEEEGEGGTYNFTHSRHSTGISITTIAEVVLQPTYRLLN